MLKKFFLIIWLCQIQLSLTYNISNINNKNATTTTKVQMSSQSFSNLTTKISTKHVRFMSNRSLPQAFVIDPPKPQLEFDEIMDPVEKYLKSIEKHGSRLRSPSTHDSAPINTEQLYYLDFEINVMGLVSFEPKTGYIELDLQLVYKWWRSREESLELNDQQGKSSSSLFYPATKFRDKKSKMYVKNQLHTMGNIQAVDGNMIAGGLEHLEEHQLLDKLERFKLFSPHSTLKPDPKRPLRTIFRHFSKLEQNVTAKFKCKQQKSVDADMMDDDEFGSLDMSKFPFDSHSCELELEIIPIEIKSSINNRTQRPVFLFPTAKLNKISHRLFVDSEFNTTSASTSLSTNFVDLYIYNNKLVQTASNYSLITREWLLKKVAVFFSNATLPILQALRIDPLEKSFDHILMSNRPNETIDPILSSSQQNALISVRFFVYRRREPQVYVFLLPLLLFTLITFLIFFLPTTQSSEKSLIAFLNFVSLLGYNLYMFKLIIYEYELARIPLILQYSNCLMVIQLGVLAYTCLVKSIYHQGFLTFGAARASFASLAEHAYRQIAVLNYQEMLESKRREKNAALADCMPVACSHQHPNHHQHQHISNQLSHNEPPIYGSVEEDTTTTHLCEKIEVMAEKCGMILNKSNNSTTGVKLNVPIIKLDGECGIGIGVGGNDLEPMNGIATIACNNEEQYLTYNNIETTVQKCICNSHETDADCSNIGISDLGHVNCGSGVLCGSNVNKSQQMHDSSSSPASETNKLISMNGTSSGGLHNGTETESSDYTPPMHHHNHSHSKSKSTAKNWLLGHCCTSSMAAAASSSPMMMHAHNISPSPVCEHVRDRDTRPRKANSKSRMSKDRSRSKSKHNHHELVLSPNANHCGLVDEERYIKYKDARAQHKAFKAVPFKLGADGNHHYNNQVALKEGLNSRALIEIGSKINLSVHKLIKLEEIYVREKLQRDEWKRKARVCDAICCLLVFFLLVVCTLFIFIILPSVKTASLID